MFVPHRAIGGLPVAVVGLDGLAETMVRDCLSARQGLLSHSVVVADSNSHGISLAATDPDYAKALSDADIVHADGAFVVWCSKLGRGPKIPERTATTDYIHNAAVAARDAGLSFYLFGGTEEVNKRCCERLLELYPGLQIAGRHHGYVDETGERDVVEHIRDSGADVVWVGLGKPRELHFALSLKSEATAGWIVTCGGCYNYITGDYKRAPKWMQKAGLEWLHRLATGPKYLLWRYATTIPHSVALVAWYDVMKPFFGKSGDARGQNK